MPSPPAQDYKAIWSNVELPRAAIVLYARRRSTYVIGKLVNEVCKNMRVAVQKTDKKATWLIQPTAQANRST